jgi:hypothetical protein
MRGAMWLAFVLAMGALGQQEPPQRMHFRDATVVKIGSTAAYYEYTIETADDGYVCRSRRRLVVTEGSRVKVAIQGSDVYIIDDEGKTQPATAVSRYRLSRATPKKTAMLRGSA